MSKTNQNSGSKALLEIPGQLKTHLPIVDSTLGNPALDISQLGKTGFFTFDPGFVSTASCISEITHIDGQQGQLYHRGYPIEQLAEKADYLETCYLLLEGDLPNRAQYQTFSQRICELRHLNPGLHAVFKGLGKKAHPMSVLMTALSALSTFHEKAWGLGSEQDRKFAAMALIAKMPVLVAMSCRLGQNLPVVDSVSNRPYVEDFLYGFFSGTDQAYLAEDPISIRALNRILILHAEHGQNASTNVVRGVGSTKVNPIACLVSGIAALWGPSHGGANEACLKMLQKIGRADRILEFLNKAKDPDDPFRLMGFGHRVYKSYDPRAKILRQTCHEVLEQQSGAHSSLSELAMKLESIALKDDYFKSRNLYPNVDFYSGITLNALGFPTEAFTPLFVLARTVGWMAHWLEMWKTEALRISRPREVYRGFKQRDVLPISERT